MSNISNIKIKPGNIKTIQRITLFSLIANLLLSAIKFGVGIIGSSQVVIADAVHSLSDSATDIAILFGVKIWSAPPDKEHPYGHLRIETVITAIIGLTLLAVAIGIGYDAITTMHSLETDSPALLWIAITGPIISIFSKEILYRWNMRVGKRIKSSALVANALEHRSDVISSIAAVLAVGAGIIDPRLSFIDNIGAIIVAVFILKVAWDILAPAFSELIDSGASEVVQKRILNTVLNFDYVKGAHAVRTRKTGNNIYVDLHVLVDGNMSVTDSHIITEKIQKKLMCKIPEIMDVVIHIEPYE
jgi:cation diffusion facilitator family transporter